MNERDNYQATAERIRAIYNMPDGEARVLSGQMEEGHIVVRGFYQSRVHTVEPGRSDAADVYVANAVRQLGLSAGLDGALPSECVLAPCCIIDDEGWIVVRGIAAWHPDAPTARH